MVGFADLDARALSAIEGAFGETIRIVPRVGGHISAAGTDPDRPTRDVAGVFSSAPKAADLFGSREAGMKPLGPTEIATSVPTLTLSAASLAALGYLPRQNDRVVLVSRPGAPAFNVSRVDVDDYGVAALFLTRESA